jgi:hypothetical protein
MSEVIHARLPAEVAAQLDQRADQELRTRSNMAAVLIARGLEAPAPKSQKEDG